MPASERFFFPPRSPYGRNLVKQIVMILNNGILGLG